MAAPQAPGPFDHITAEPPPPGPINPNTSAEAQRIAEELERDRIRLTIELDLLQRLAQEKEIEVEEKRAEWQLWDDYKGAKRLYENLPQRVREHADAMQRERAANAAGGAGGAGDAGGQGQA